MRAWGNEGPLVGARAGLRIALFLLLLVSPLPFGAVQSRAVLALQIYAAGLAAAAALILLRDPRGLPPLARRLLIPAGLVAGVGLLQLIPLPTDWTVLLRSAGATARGQVASLVPATTTPLAPASLEPPATLDALLRLLAYIMVGVAVVVAVRNRAHFRQAAVVVAISGTFQALYGSAEYLTGHQHIFGYAKEYFHDEASGTFINRNHFAGYLAMTLPFALVLVVEGARRLPGARNWKERLLRLNEPGALLVFLGGLASAVIWIGVLLSYSRAGLAAAVLAFAFFAVSAAGRRMPTWLLLLLLLPTLFILSQGVRMPGARFVAGNQELARLGDRVPVWRATLRIAGDHLPLGTGLGTFEDAFSLYRPATVDGTWRHAHNDWLETLAEGGVVVALATVAVLIIVLAARRRMGPASVRSGYGIGVIAGTAALLAISLHSVIDFCLRIPANAVLLACVIGLTCAAATMHATPRHDESR